MTMTRAFILFLESKINGNIYVDVGQLMHILFLKGILYTTEHVLTSSRYVVTLVPTEFYWKQVRSEHVALTEFTL